jgi:hypothetical protein
MGRNEIRLRRTKVSSGQISRHRNYAELLRQHGQNMRMKRIVKTFIYFLIITILTLLLIIVIRWERKSNPTAHAVTRFPSGNTLPGNG